MTATGKAVTHDSAQRVSRIIHILAAILHTPGAVPLRQLRDLQQLDTYAASQDLPVSHAAHLAARDCGNRVAFGVLESDRFYGGAVGG